MVSAGAVGLRINRAYGGAGVGLLGAHWRIDWENRIERRGSSYVVTEGVRQIDFSLVDGAHLGPPGERIVTEAGTLVRVRGDLTRDGFDTGTDRLARLWRRQPCHRDLQLRQAGRIEGPRGIFLSFTFDPAGRVVQITSSTGEAVSYSYSGNDLVAVETSKAPTVRYTYAGGRLTRIEDPAVGPITFTYDAKLPHHQPAPGGRHHASLGIR